jgi:hypothetical protein
MVVRPLEPWKKGLIWSMAGLLAVLLISKPSQEFFDLDMPRLAIILAAVGVVAIAGGVMLGTLRAVGWIKHVPELLREHPPDARRFWRATTQRIRTFGGRTASPLDEAFTKSDREPPVPSRQESAAAHAPTAETATAADLDPDPIERARTIDWFDPDVDPYDVLNEPTSER